MTTTDIPTKPLWRCVLRKSMSVTEKLVLYASCVVCAIAVFTLNIYGSIVIASVITYPMRMIINVIKAFVSPDVIFNIIYSLLTTIPWYAYLVAIVIATILIYSWGWCISREFTEDDIRYECCHFGHLAALMFGFAGLGGVVGVVVVYIITNGIFAVSIIGMLFALPACFIGPYIQPFVSAYLHYRKRIKEAK